MTKKIEDKIYQYSLENAINFNGKANPKAILGKVIKEFPEIKKDMKTNVQKINEIVEKVNKIDIEEQKEEIKKINPDYFNQQKEKKQPNKKDGLPELPGTENGVIVRFPPAPSGHLHIGHLFGIVANYEFKKKYGGKFILRFEDTNPDNIDIKNYEKVIEDVKWITENGIDEIHYQSDRLEIYYKYIRSLIELDFAYVCHCKPEIFKEYTDNKEECPCSKNRDVEHHVSEFSKMFNQYKPGEALVRARGDINDKNPALRTFPIARINHNKHARVGNKYSVWPNYNLACSIDDSLMKLTHVIRGKDLEIGEIRQKMIHKKLGLKSPYYFHYGRMKFEDIELSKTKLTQLIEDGKYTGWDDPRVPSILSFKKRGYLPEAFRKFILHLGISKRDSKITMEEYLKGLNFFNKQILEKEANRYFFIHNPKEILIENIKEIKFKEIELPKHPEDKSRGKRTFPVIEKYLISGVDFDNLEEGDKFRLMHFGNFRISKKEENKMTIKYISKDYSKEFNAKRNIHYLPKKQENNKAKIILQDNSKLNGIVEEIKNLKDGENIQFERFGFVKYDKKDKNGEEIFYFTHK